VNILKSSINGKNIQKNVKIFHKKLHKVLIIVYNKALCHFTLIEERCMEEPIKRKKRRFRSQHRGHIIYAALVAVGLFLIGFALTDLLTGEQEYSAARSEYESLRELSPVMSMISSGLIRPAGNPTTRDAEEAEPAQVSVDEQMPEDALSSSDSAGFPISDLPVSPNDPLAELSEMNPDFIGWIYIEGVLDYPVVRGRDNDRYLNVTFKGSNNPSGAIFMDNRNSKGFGDPVCVLFGHNMRDGSMFKPLHKYSSRTFLEEHPDIVIVTASGDVLYYRIFAAKYESSRDLLYELCLSDWSANPSEFRNAPDGTSHFLVLSTCTNSEDKEERLRVFAALEG